MTGFFWKLFCVGALRTLIGPSKIWTLRKSEGTERQFDGQVLQQAVVISRLRISLVVYSLYLAPSSRLEHPQIGYSG